MNASKSRPKKILEIINMPSSARNFIGGQFLFLRQNGYDMHLICSPDDLMEDYAKHNQIKYYPIRLDRTMSFWNDLIAFLRICKYIKKNNIDTIIAHQAKARLLGTTAAFLMRVPNRIIFAHGILFETMKGCKRKLVIFMDKIVAAMAHKTVCVSQSVARVRQQYKIENIKQEYLIGAGTCNGIDTINHFNPQLLIEEEQNKIKNNLGIGNEDFVVGFCGRIVKDKGINELVEGFKILKQNHANSKIKLIIIGKSEKRDNVSSKLLEYINTNPNIIHIEQISHDKICNYFALFSVVVLPSYREGFGMVTIECGAMNVPAIVSMSTGCIDSIVENKTGLYCKITPESIAEKLEYFYNHPTDRENMGKNARKWIIENFDSSIIWPNIIKVIEA